MPGLHPPLSVVATWKPNYTNPETSGRGVIAVVAVLLVICYGVVSLRLWARFFLTKNAGIDDALIIFNMVPLTGLSVALFLAMTRYGFDKHVWDNTTGVLISARKVTIAIEALYMVSTATTKISILLFYRRLAAGSVSPRFLGAVYASIAFVVVYFCIFFFMMFGICRPLSTYWMQADYFWYAANEGKFDCLNEASTLVASAIISAIQDFIACGLPMALLWKLRIPKKQKIALGAIFSVGFFLCICSILRIIYVVRVYYTTYDMTWESQPAWMWLAIETHVAVICASAPALKIFFKNNMEGSSRGYGLRYTSYNKSGMSNSTDTEASEELQDNKGHRKVEQCMSSSERKKDRISIPKWRKVLGIS